MFDHRYPDIFWYKKKKVQVDAGVKTQIIFYAVEI